MKNLFINYSLKKKANIVLTLSLILFPLIQFVDGHKYKDFDILYTYNYGLIFPWIEMFNNDYLGSTNLLTSFHSQTYAGVSWYPQNVLFGLLAINIIVIIAREVTYKIKLIK